MDGGAEGKMAFFPVDSEILRELSLLLLFSILPESAFFHLSVEDMNYTLLSIERSNEKTVRPKIKIEAESRGYFALFH
jgi:hypothetical protein